MTHMAALGLREAAQQVGLHRSSIFRAIRAGRLSATRTESGDFLIDPAELFRVYSPKPAPESETVRVQQGAQVGAEQSTQGDETERTSSAVRVARLEGQVAALEAELRGVRELADTLRRECDRWAAQAERLALAPPQRRSWWPWRRTAG